MRRLIPRPGPRAERAPRPEPEPERRSAGFSVLELAVVLVILGILGALLWRAMPRIAALPILSRAGVVPLVRAQEALDGFIVAHGRLPCPATAGANTGLEDCSTGHVIGLLPVNTLGLSLPGPVRYGVYRAPPAASVAADGDLGTLVDRYAPLLPGWLFPGYGALADPVTMPDQTAMPAAPVNLNGLDFCAGLLNLMRHPGASLNAGGTPIAYGLALPGASDADAGPVDAATGIAGFDGDNARPAMFAAEGTSASATYNDSSHTVGLGQLFGRLDCAARLGAVNGAARAAYAAYDTYRLALMLRQFREFQLTVRLSNADISNWQLMRASAMLVSSIANVVTGAALVYETFGAAAPVLAMATFSIGGASVDVATTVITYQSAQTAVSKARKQVKAATTFEKAARDDYCLARASSPTCTDGAVSRVLALDAQGLLP